MATDKESLTARFRAMKFNDNKHLGLGDVRLTLWEQEQIEKEFADLRERHGAFVRAAKDDAIAAEGYLSLDGRMRNWAAFMAAQRIIALCDAELAKEMSNG